MAYYPQELNGQPIYIKTMKEGTVKKVLKSNFDGGYQQQRPQFTRAYKTFDLSYNILTDDEIVTLDTFFQTYQGMSFTFVHPVKNTEHTVMFDMDEFDLTYESGVVRRDVAIKLREV